VARNCISRGKFLFQAPGVGISVGGRPFFTIVVQQNWWGDCAVKKFPVRWVPTDQAAGAAQPAPPFAWKKPEQCTNQRVAGLLGKWGNAFLVSGDFGLGGGGGGGGGVKPFSGFGAVPNG